MIPSGFLPNFIQLIKGPKSSWQTLRIGTRPRHSPRGWTAGWGKPWWLGCKFRSGTHFGIVFVFRGEVFKLSGDTKNGVQPLPTLRCFDGPFFSRFGWWSGAIDIRNIELVGGFSIPYLKIYVQVKLHHFLDGIRVKNKNDLKPPRWHKRVIE